MRASDSFQTAAGLIAIARGFIGHILCLLGYFILTKRQRGIIVEQAAMQHSSAYVNELAKQARQQMGEML